MNNFDLLLAIDLLDYVLREKFWIGQAIGVGAGALIGSYFARPWKWSGAFAGGIAGWISIFFVRLTYRLGEVLPGIFGGII